MLDKIKIYNRKTNKEILSQENDNSSYSLCFKKNGEVWLEFNPLLENGVNCKLLSNDPLNKFPELKDFLLPKINLNVKQGSTIVTDTYHAYKDLKKNYKHKTVKHSAGEYSRNEKDKEGRTAFKVHTNSIEGFWSLVKRTINGTHHWISKKHINKYLGEMSFRYNTSDMQDNERFVNFLQMSFKKLTYKELICC